MIKSGINMATLTLHLQGLSQTTKKTSLTLHLQVCDNNKYCNTDVESARFVIAINMQHRRCICKGCDHNKYGNTNVASAARFVIIIIYHDFLPPPRRGGHVKSANTHTHNHQYTPLSPYTLQFILTALCNGIPPFSR